MLRVDVALRVGVVVECAARFAVVAAVLFPPKDPVCAAVLTVVARVADALCTAEAVRAAPVRVVAALVAPVPAVRVAVPAAVRVAVPAPVRVIAAADLFAAPGLDCIDAFRPAVLKDPVVALEAPALAGSDAAARPAKLPAPGFTPRVKARDPEYDAASEPGAAARPYPLKDL